MNEDTFNNKRLVFKVYDSAGAYLGIMPNVATYPNWSERLNEAGSSIDIDIADMDYDDELVQAGNRIDVYAYYGAMIPWTDEDGTEITTHTSVAITFSVGSPTGSKIFMGRITKTKIQYGSDHITVTLASPGSDLLQHLASETPNMGYMGETFWGGISYTDNWLEWKYAIPFIPVNNGTLSGVKTGAWQFFGDTELAPLNTNTFYNGAIAYCDVYQTNDPTTGIIDANRVAHAELTLTSQVPVLDSDIYGGTWGYTDPHHTGWTFDNFRVQGGVRYYFVFRTNRIGSLPGVGASNHGENILPWVRAFSNYPTSFTTDPAYISYRYTTDFGGVWQPWTYVEDNGVIGAVVMPDITMTYDATTLTKTDTVSNILEYLIRIVELGGGLVHTIPGSVEENNQIITIELNTQNILSSIQTVMKTIGKDWYWFIDVGTGVFYFRQSSPTPDIYFTLGKDIADAVVDRSIEKIVNTIYFTGGQLDDGYNLLRSGSNAESVNAWGQRLKLVSDSNVKDVETADAIIASELAAYADPVYTTSITITDQQYNSLLIVIGKRIGFLNFNNSINDLALQVVGLTRGADGVTMELATIVPKTSNQMVEIAREVEKLRVARNPETATE